MKLSALFNTLFARVVRKLKIVRKLQKSSWFAIASVVMLLATTGWWAWLSARIHLHNADQLVEQFLFEHSPTLHAAVMPGAHSFILKWPLFFLIRVVGINEITLISATVILTLVTVGLLAYILYHIIRRPLLFGVICLALASVLLMIPTEPYPGALLPVNMAMLTTRNIEYVLYIVALILIIKSARLVHWKPFVALFLLTSIIASDKLFLVLTVGGASIMLVVAIIRRQANERRLALRWLSVGLLAGLLSMAALWIITKTGLVIIHNSDQTSPFALVHSIKELTIGVVYAIMGILTNLGANPAFDATIIKDIPGHAAQRLLSIEGLAYLFNIGLVCGIILAVRQFFKRSFLKSTHETNTAHLLSWVMVWSTLASILVFIVTDHYHPVDSRYLSIVTFTSFIVFATQLRTTNLATSKTIVRISLVLILVVLTSGLMSAWQQAQTSMNFYNKTHGYDQLISAALDQHSTQTLIGDYWRVMPVKLHDPSQQVYPLSNCTTPRDVLLSNAWKPDTAHDSFAYLLSIKPSITGFPACTIDQVVEQYGRPNNSQLIAGTADKPEEILLFYDYGVNRAAFSSSKAPASAILPHSINELSELTCTTGKTIMNIVAHQDDDILFINPDTYRHLNSGDCVRSVYLTAGDAGHSAFYWLGREEGSKAAYATMLGLTNPSWISRTVAISSKSYVTIAKLKDDPRVTLTFMHLPDGNVNGKGFPDTHHESLAELESSRISVIHSVDKQSAYSSQDLIEALAALMTTYQPSEIETQASINHSKKYPDHSDHLMTGWYVNQAYTLYHQQQPSALINFYIGYPERDRPANVSGNDLAVTDAAFFAYAQHDKGTCESVVSCSKMSYAYYLSRQYKE